MIRSGRIKLLNVYMIRSGRIKLLNVYMIRSGRIKLLNVYVTDFFSQPIILYVAR